MLYKEEEKEVLLTKHKVLLYPNFTILQFEQHPIPIQRATIEGNAAFV